jgi:amino acid adenylation domain-containing protein
MPKEKTYSLSPQQARLWALQNAAGAAPFRVQCLASITGALDRAALKEALDDCVRRQEILRTSFTVSGDTAGVVQTVNETGPFALDAVVLEGLSDFEQKEKVTALWHSSLQLPFDPVQPLRAVLIVVSPVKSFLLISLPALCADVPAAVNLVRETGEAYVARKRGENPAIKATQYGELANWQNELLEAPELKIGREYWSKLGLEKAGAHKLPFQKQPSSPPAEFAVQEHISRLPGEATLRIRQAAEKHETSISSFVLACWAVLLSRSVSAPEIMMGVACDGRKYEELKSVAGPLMKFLPTALSCPEDASFASVLLAVEKTVAANCKWQECFSWQDAAPALPPLSSGFEYVPEAKPWMAGGLTFTIERYWSCIDRFPIRLVCLEQDCGLTAEIYYDAHYFQAEEILLLSERLHAILESAASAPQTPVSDLQVLGPTERRKVVAEFNATASHSLPELCIHELFEQQVERTPEALAIITPAEQTTYRDLNRRANQLARFLRRHGTGIESRVAILMERSLDMFVAVMAVMKAGAAYVPLDSQHPAGRISYVLGDASPAVLLTQRHLARNLPAWSGKTIFMDEQSKVIAQEDETNLSVPLVPECLAYLIYTSGSTGAPKGSMIAHRGLVNHAQQMIGLYDLRPGRRMLQFFSLSFDASAEDIFPSLLSGAALVCPPDFLDYSPSGLLAFCRRFEITTLHLPVVLWHQLVDEVSNGNYSLPPQVQMLSVGGESPSASKLANWNRMTAGHAAFRNVYGPTEATITASVYRQDAQTRVMENAPRVPIGRPLANVPIYLLNAAMQPVPIGMQGEIYIGGVALARGYVNQPGLTAEKFVPDPFSGREGARLYKTGDLAQFSIGGEIDFLGRIDHQVKIRGFRVELEEIERFLLTHPAIQETVVTVHENGAGDKRLAAYVTLKPRQSANATQIRHHLRERLPEYMVPTWFVVLNSLPMTHTGKIDRKALPVPTNENLGPEQEYLAPRTPTEEIVAAIFAELLQKSPIGILDNFFESGGHSLLAVQLASRLRETFQVEVSLRKIFEDSTVAGLAAALLERDDERLRVERTAELMTKLAAISDDQAETMLEKPLG